MTVQERFEEIVRDNIKREGIEDILSMLSKSDFYTAPASTRFHGSEPEGLVKHSVGVWKKLVAKKQFMPDVSDETIAIVSLFHDFCKIGFYDVEMRNRKNERGQWEKYPFYIVNDLFPMGHGEKSVIMIMSLMALTDEEMMAIRWHMGGYEPKENYLALGNAMSMCPLIVHLHSADLEATYIDGI